MKYNPSDVVRASDTYPGDRPWNDLSRFYYNSTMENVSTRQKGQEALHQVPPDLSLYREHYTGVSCLIHNKHMCTLSATSINNYYLEI